MKLFRIGLYCIAVSFLFANIPAIAGDVDRSNLMDEYEEKSVSSTVPDPLYRYNKIMFHFNDKLYYWGIKPVATGYKKAVPDDVRQCVKIFFTNVLFPVRFVNSLFQGKVKPAGEELAIFAVNTTVGCLGLGRPAQDEFDLQISKEDFGQTLGSYSFKQGFYVIWPVLGPSTLRDTIGRAGDYFLNPLNCLEGTEVVYGAKILDKVNAASFRIGEYEALKQGAVDPYTSLKNVYIQHRAEAVGR